MRKTHSTQITPTKTISSFPEPKNIVLHVLAVLTEEGGRYMCQTKRSNKKHSTIRFKVFVERRLVAVAGGGVLSTRPITFIFTGEVLNVTS
jgi:hypothetical protein